MYKHRRHARVRSDVKKPVYGYDSDLSDKPARPNLGLDTMTLFKSILSSENAAKQNKTMSTAGLDGVSSE